MKTSKTKTQVTLDTTQNEDKLCLVSNVTCVFVLLVFILCLVCNVTCVFVLLVFILCLVGDCRYKTQNEDKQNKNTGNIGYKTQNEDKQNKNTGNIGYKTE
jgi:hypothetical protein